MRWAWKWNRSSLSIVREASTSRKSRKKTNFCLLYKALWEIWKILANRLKKAIRSIMISPSMSKSMTLSRIYSSAGMKGLLFRRALSISTVIVRNLALNSAISYKKYNVIRRGNRTVLHKSGKTSQKLIKEIAPSSRSTLTSVAQCPALKKDKIQQNKNHKLPKTVIV